MEYTLWRGCAKNPKLKGIWRKQVGSPTVAFINEMNPIIRGWGCKPKPPKIPSPQIESRHDRIQVNELSIAAEGVVPVQQDVPPGRQ